MRFVFRHDPYRTRVLVSALCALLGGAALAQSEADLLAELRECAEIQTDRARWNCFDGVFAREARADDVAQAVSASGAEAESRAATRAAADSAPTATTAAIPTAAVPTAQAAAASTAAVAATQSSTATAEPERRSQRSREEDEEAQRIVRVVNLIALARGNLRFVTDEGEVFTQPVGEPRGRYPDIPFDAEIDTGPMQNYFIRPVEIGPRTRVRLND